MWEELHYILILLSCSYSVPVLRCKLLNLALTLLCLHWTQSLTHLSMCVIAQSYVITVIAFACYGSGYQAVTRTMLSSLDTVYLAGTLVTQPTQFTHTHKINSSYMTQIRLHETHTVECTPINISVSFICSWLSFINRLPYDNLRTPHILQFAY